MRIAVFGAGAVGAQIALRLTQAGYPTSVIARGKHLQAIVENGLTLETPDGVTTCRLEATSDSRSLGVQDVVVVALKGTALAAAVPDIHPLVGEHTRVMYAMNGLPWWFSENTGDPEFSSQLRSFLDPDGVIASLVPLDRLIWSMVLLGGGVTEPGRIVSWVPGRGSLTLGYADGHVDEKINDICAALAKAGIDASLETSIREKIWFKLLMNAGQATVATLSERNARDTVSDPELRTIIVACMREILAVGRAIGVNPKADPVAMTEKSRHGPHRSSMLQDLEAGRPLELRPTILAVRHIARLKGIPVPHLNTVAALISARSADSQRERP